MSTVRSSDCGMGTVAAEPREVTLTANDDAAARRSDARVARFRSEAADHRSRSFQHVFRSPPLDIART